jgi:PKD repeat protein
VSGSTVYIGGQFTSVTDSAGTGTVTRNNAAAVNATTGDDTGWNPNPNNIVQALAVSGSTVYLGGQFTSVVNSGGFGTVTRNYAAAVNATTGADTGWNPNPNNVVQALAVSGSTVYLGGFFTSVGLLPQSYIADFTTLPPPTAGFTSAQTPGALSVSFTDTSTAASLATITGWVWNFGDGSTSTSQNPTHTYAAAGRYMVSLTVTDSDAQTDQISHQIVVAGAPVATITSPANGRAYTLHEQVKTTFACHESTYGPGLSGCVDSNHATAPSGSLNTSHTGQHVYTVTATSSDGQTATAQIRYTVALPSNHFTVSHLKAHNGTVAFDLKLSGPGQINAVESAPHGLTFAHKRLNAPGARTVRVIITPDQRGRRLIKHHPDHPLRIGLSITYTPTYGTARTVRYHGLDVAG